VRSVLRPQKRAEEVEAAVVDVVVLLPLAEQPLQQADVVVADVAVQRRLAQHPQQPAHHKQRPLQFLPFRQQRPMVQQQRAVEVVAEARRLQPAVVEAVVHPQQVARPQVVAVVEAERQQLQQARRFN
jgi:hypothetical protein